MYEHFKDPTFVPVKLTSGTVEFLALAEDETPTYQIFIKADKSHLVTTGVVHEDSVSLAGITLEEAVGKFLMANPKLTYDDIEEHQEI